MHSIVRNLDLTMHVCVHKHIHIHTSFPTRCLCLFSYPHLVSSISRERSDHLESLHPETHFCKFYAIIITAGMRAHRIGQSNGKQPFFLFICWLAPFPSFPPMAMLWQAHIADTLFIHLQNNSSEVKRCITIAFPIIIPSSSSGCILPVDALPYVLSMPLQ